MATQFISAVNVVLGELNEETLTAFSSAVGFHSFVITAVRKSVQDVYRDRMMWPFAKVLDYSDRLTPGVQVYDLPTSAAHVDWDSFFLLAPEDVVNHKISGSLSGWTTSGSAVFVSNSSINGASLDQGAAISQELTTIGSSPYRLVMRHTGGPVAITVGTSEGGSNLLSAVSNVRYSNQGEAYYATFDTLSTPSTFVRLEAISGSATVDYVRVNENIDSVQLRPIDFDDWKYNHKSIDIDSAPDSWTKPLQVFQTTNNRYGVTGVPDKRYSLRYDYWSVADALSGSADLIQIPDRWMPVVYEGALMYAYRFRRDFDAAKIASTNREDMLRTMRRELIDPKINRAFPR